MREWLTSNTGLKIVALVLATVMWFYVNSITNEHRVIDGVRVESITASQMAVQRISEPTVSVVLRGAHSDLSQITRADLTAVIDLRDQPAPGKIRVLLAPDCVRHPQRVQVIQINPKQLYVWLVAAPANNTM